jgi:uncharacterized protein (DUF2267 family)
MSATGLDVFDKTLQTTHIWLDQITARIGPDRQLAWKVLSIVLRQLRDRLPVELAAHLSAELPILVRGVYYDQYKPSNQPSDHDLDEFVQDVGKWLSDVRPVDPREAIQAVFGVLSSHVPKGQIRKVQDALPEKLRAFWISAEESLDRSAGQAAERR